MVSRERQTISVEEAARILGIGRSTAFEAVRRGDIPHLRISPRRIVIPIRALERLLDAAEGKANED